jgi:putative two-component system response regulator
MRHVLIVDDEEDFARSIVKILVHSGYEADYVTGGRECLEKLQRGFHGLILMDINMPGTNGWETIAEIVAGGYSANVIICMLTGCGDPDPGMDDLKECVLDYITKPVEAGLLVDTVRQYLDYLKPPATA